MRKALIVGINEYFGNELTCCVNDARMIESLLSEHYDGTSNFETEILLDQQATKQVIENELYDLFNDDDVEIGLFYFSGHGCKINSDTYLMTIDGDKRSPGISLNNLLSIVNNASCKYKIIILDCCSAGALEKNFILNGNVSAFGDGVIIMSSCKDSSKAYDDEQNGLFTKLLIKALSGEVGDILGNVTILKMYEFVESLLGAWKQRPVLKCSVSQNLIIRKAEPLIQLKVLKSALKIFVNEEDIVQLNPTYFDFRKSFDPIDIDPIKENQKKFNLLLELDELNLIEYDATNLYNAARNYRMVKLSNSGKYYLNLLIK